MDIEQRPAPLSSRGATALKRIEREPLCDLAHTQLRDALLAGRFEPGASLTLRALAESFGISITPVRDAVTRLVAQGVLQLGSRNSAIVPHLTAGELKHITMVRCALEGRAAREAAGNPDPKARARLEAGLATMRSLIADRQMESYLDHHRKFHFGIYAMSENPVLVDLIENTWLRCGPALSFVIPQYVLSLKGSDHHKAALNGILDGKPDVAEAAIIADITEAATYLTGLADATGRLCAPKPMPKQSGRAKRAG
jgi:DNA-binding GntR family transcriptional regulator